MPVFNFFAFITAEENVLGCEGNYPGVGKLRGGGGYVRGEMFTEHPNSQSPPKYCRRSWLVKSI